MTSYSWMKGSVIEIVLLKGRLIDLLENMISIGNCDASTRLLRFFIWVWNRCIDPQQTLTFQSMCLLQIYRVTSWKFDALLIACTGQKPWKKLCWPRTLLKGPKRSFVVVFLVVGVETWAKNVPSGTKNVRVQIWYKLNKKWCKRNKKCSRMKKGVQSNIIIA